MLREGGNAVDAALGGDADVVRVRAAADRPRRGRLHARRRARASEPVLLDFFVEAPGRGPTRRARRAVPISVSFGDAIQIFNIGAASVGAYGMPRGSGEAPQRFGTHAARRPGRARRPRSRATGVEVNARAGLRGRDPGAGSSPRRRSARRCSRPAGALLRAGDTIRQPELADALERLGAEGAAPFYTGDIARRDRRLGEERGGIADRGGPAPPTRSSSASRCGSRYRGREVLTNPPPSAGGILIAYALGAARAAPRRARAGERSSR